VVAEDRISSLGRVKGSLTIVADVLGALGELGRAARARSGAKIAAITGSVGKTGTKEMLARGLAPEGPVHASPASFNNHWGVPLTRRGCRARFAVFEIGMNHAGEIEPLVKMVRPHAAIVTTVEPVHLEYFKDVKAIAKAKGEIFLGLEPGGAAIINRDNPHYAALAKMARSAGAETVVGFGEHAKAEARLEKVKLKEDCSCVSAAILGEAVSYKLGAPGRHLVQNSLAVLAAVSILGGDLAKAALALGSLAAPKGRGERHRLESGGRDAL
jgi:UDP-N-acetylmuramoyl-tripeptide--D-alanyl-D-alanine ligase